ncbi:MAG: DM13 domain-containing protein [Actinomycetota bacterium]|nr:DM13 domain-containing protein [Actinomycetota bacterium]
MEDRSEDTRRLVTPKRLWIAAGVAAILGVVVLVWFQPQKLFIDERVDEAPPGAMADEDAAMDKDGDAMTEDAAMDEDDDAMAEEDDAMTLGGDFRSIDHETSGRLSLTKAPDGHYYVRLEDFRTENGPDLFVYLSAAQASSDGREFADEFLNLGRLKGNVGNQNYLVPDGTDLEQYRSVVIWCRRFTSPFGAAPLELR